MKTPAFLKRLPLFAEGTSTELRTWQWLALVGGGIAFFLPVDAFCFSICFFYNLTGLPCPGCGMTRAVHFALHLDPLHAFYYHPVGLFAAVGIVFFWVSAVWRPAGRVFERYKRHTAVALLAVAGNMLIFGVARAGLFALDAPETSEVLRGFEIVLQDQRLRVGPGAGVWCALLSLESVCR